MVARQSLLGYLLSTRNIVLISIVLECVLLYFYYSPEAKLWMGDETRYFNTGLSIAAGGDWHNHPLWPPMQSVLIAFFSQFFGQSLLPIQLFQYVMLVFAGFIVRDITWRTTSHRLASQLSLVIMLWYPSWLAYSQYLWPEVIHVCLFVSILWINHYKNNNYLWMAFSGGLLGLAVLFKSVLILFIPVLFWPLFSDVKKIDFNWRSAFMRVLLSLSIAIIVIGPASLKAHKMTGGWMVSNSSMFNLWYGLKDDKRQHFVNDKGGGLYRQYMKSGSDFASRNLWARNQALEQIKKQGVMSVLITQLKKQYFRLFDHQSFFTQQFRGEKGFKNKYHHSSDDVFVRLVVLFDHAFYLCILLGMALGIVVSLKHSLMAKQLALFLLYTLALFLLLHAKPRFRIPLMPLMAFFSAALWHYQAIHQVTVNKVLSNKKIYLTVIVVVFIVFSFVFAGGILDKIFPI